MKFKKHLMFFGVICLLSLSLFSTVPVVAFSVDSFSQQIGDEYIWEYTATYGSAMLGFPSKVGDRVKILIINTSVENMMDTITANLYNNSAANRIWSPLMTSWILGQYNNTHGYKDTTGFPFVIPHNETAVNNSMYDLAQDAGLKALSYKWASGPNGYDGKAEFWNGSAAGDAGQPKYIFKFNKDGILEYYREYSGISSWYLFLSLDLIPDAPILESIISPDTDGIIDLKWNDITSATTYYIYRNNTVISTTINTTFNDMVSTNAIYCYTVMAGTETLNSSQSNIICVTVEISKKGGIPGFELTYLIILLSTLAIISFRKKHPQKFP